MKKIIQYLKVLPIAIRILAVLCLLPEISQGQLIKLHDFSGYPSDGNLPYGFLISDGTYLYGMTQSGGANSKGAIFRIMPDGTNYTLLYSFTGNSTSGSSPYGSLILVGTYLYGVTAFGGVNNEGTVFKIMPDGTNYTTLYNCVADTSSGTQPRGSLIFDGTYLYGTTEQGGVNDLGTVFKITTGGTYTKLYDFAGTTNGSLPEDDLVFVGSDLYGMTLTGGTNNKGTVYKITTSGTYTKLYDFAGTTSPSSGSNPFGSLISDGTYLYGMTQAGGANDLGTVFKITTTGTYTPLYDFAGTTTSGSNPAGSLFYDGTYLYGMTAGGGANSSGALFEVKPDGTGYLDLVDFAGTSNGATPLGELISDGLGFVYGMTYTGGTNNDGTIFKYHHCDMPLTISDATTYNGSTWSTYNYSTITIGTNSATTITAGTDQDFKFSNNTVVNGPFSTGTGGNTIDIVPTPCP